MNDADQLLREVGLTTFDAQVDQRKRENETERVRWTGAWRASQRSAQVQGLRSLRLSRQKLRTQQRTLQLKTRKASAAATAPAAMSVARDICDETGDMGESEKGAPAG